MTTAYLIAFEDRQTKTVVGAGIFSEASPTCTVNVRPIVLFQREAASFGEACDAIRGLLQILRTQLR